EAHVGPPELPFARGTPARARSSDVSAAANRRAVIVGTHKGRVLANGAHSSHRHRAVKPRESFGFHALAASSYGGYKRLKSQEICPSKNWRAAAGVDRKKSCGRLLRAARGSRRGPKGGPRERLDRDSPQHDGVLPRGGDRCAQGASGGRDV